MIKQVLVLGASPDFINNNAVMRSFVAEGFAELFTEGSVRHGSLDEFDLIIHNFSPDLIVLFGSCMPDICLYDSVKDYTLKNSIPLAVWLHDEPYEFDCSYKVTEIADYIFSNDRNSCLYYKHGQVYHLPMAASPRHHLREVSAEKSRDLFFCGVAFQNRVQLFRDCHATLNQYKTEVYGCDWPEDLKFASNKRIENQKLSDYNQSSHLVLNVGRHFNLANSRYNIVPSTPGPRTFEAAMSGAVQLYFLESLEIEDYYQENTEMLYFDNPHQLSELCNYYLQNPQELAKIAHTSQQRTLDEHCYKHRAQKMLDIIGV